VSLNSKFTDVYKKVRTVEPLDDGLKHVGLLLTLQFVGLSRSVSFFFARISKFWDENGCSLLNFSAFEGFLTLIALNL